jgi:hypothetical protein
MNYRWSSAQPVPSLATWLAVLLNARCSQTRQAVGLERMLPRKKFLLRQLIAPERFLHRDPANAHRRHHSGFATHYPSLGIRWR